MGLDWDHYCVGEQGLNDAFQEAVIFTAFHGVGWSMPLAVFHIEDPSDQIQLATFPDDRKMQFSDGWFLAYKYDLIPEFSIFLRDNIYRPLSSCCN